MNRIGRMMLMASMDGKRHQDYERREYPGMDYEPDSRFRDRRGREHYDNGRYAPQNDGGMWVDSRYWDDREAYRPMESRYPMTIPYVPPVYRDRRVEEEGMRPMNRIGFRVTGDMDRMAPEFGREYRTDAGHHRMDEMAYRRGGRMSGYGSGSGGRPFNREMAQEWVQRMHNADGTTGPHWTMEQTEAARAQHGVNCDPLAFWVAMNMIYSDYSKAAEKIGANKMEFYVCMAKAFLDDKDSRNQGGEKLARYYEYVVN